MFQKICNYLSILSTVLVLGILGEVVVDAVAEVGEVAEGKNVQTKTKAYSD